MQLKREWSFEDALDAHEWLDALEAAQAESRDRARRDAAAASKLGRG
jgi:hypothetical protein